MDKLIKSLYLSIIFSGLIYLVLHYFSLIVINPVIFIFILIIVLYILFYFYLKLTNTKYTSKEIADKYNLSVDEKVDTSIIQDKSLLMPVEDKPAVPFPKELILKENSIVLEEISTPVKITPIVKKPKIIPKQNVNYRNYAEVFKTINKSIQKENNDKQNLKEEKTDSLDNN